MPIFLLAQESYTLSEMIEIGLENNLDYIESKISLENSKSSLLSSYYEILPNANLTSSKSYDLKSDSDSRTAGFSLSKTLYLDEPTYFSIEQSALNKNNYRLSAKYSKKEIAYNIIDKYLNLIESMESLQIQKRNITLKEKSIEKINIKYENGEATIIDKQNSEITLFDYKINLKQTENQIEKQRKDLFAYINIEDNNEKLLKPNLEIKDQNYRYNLPISLQKEKNDLKKTKLSLLQQKLDFLPTLSLSANYNYNYENSGSVFSSENYDDDYGISLNLSYSLFNPIKHKENYKRDKRSYRIQRLRFELNKRESVNEFENMLAELENQKEIYDLMKQKETFAKKNFDIAKEQYDLGMINILDFEDAQNNYLQSKLELNSQFYSLLRQQQLLNLYLNKEILGKY